MGIVGPEPDFGEVVSRVFGFAIVVILSVHELVVARSVNAVVSVIEFLRRDNGFLEVQVFLGDVFLNNRPLPIL